MAKAGRGNVNASHVLTTAQSVVLEAGDAANSACSMRRHTFSANRGGSGDVTCHSRRTRRTASWPSNSGFISFMGRMATLAAVRARMVDAGTEPTGQGFTYCISSTPRRRESRRLLEQLPILSPLRGSCPSTPTPTAGAVGYFLALL